MPTYIFSDVAPGPDALGVQAMGFGMDAISAMADARTRLAPRLAYARQNGLATLALLERLEQSLNDATAFEVHRLFRDDLELACADGTCSSRATAMLVDILGRRQAVHDYLDARRDNIQEAAQGLRRSYAPACASMGLNHRLVDWLEVASQAATREVAREVQAAQPVVAQARAGSSGRASVPESEEGAGRPIDRAVLEVLRESSLDGTRLRLPARQLDRKLYERVNEVLVAMGGRWVGGKTRAHVFEEDPAEMIELALATGRYINPRDFEFFPTPQDIVVHRLLPMAALERGMRVLEPQAGLGAIARPVAEIVGFEHVTVVDILPRHASKLKEQGYGQVLCADFLDLEPEPVFDRIIMNPPFSNLADVSHLQHALRWLNPEGRLISITAPAWEFHQTRRAQEFRDLLHECRGEVQSIEAGAFASSGTQVATRIVTIEAENLPWYRDRAVSRPMAPGR